MLKLGNIEFKEEEIKEEFFNKEKKFIIQFRDIYQIFYSENIGFYANKIYHEYGKLPLTKRGRFFISNAKTINDLVGRELVID